MNDWLVIALGLFAQALFTGRFFIQWLTTEKQKKSVVPEAFWYMSIAGGTLLYIYTYIQNDPVYMFGLGLNLAIYVRNIIFIRKEKEHTLTMVTYFWYVFLSVSLGLFLYSLYSLGHAIINHEDVIDHEESLAIIIFGLIGQFLFTGRFIVQWLATEINKKSTVPISFWYLSLSGGLILLVYEALRQDPVLVLAQSTGSIVYIRNLYFIYKGKKLNHV